MSFHQSGDMTVPGAANQVTLPMAGDGAILDFRRPFSNGNGIDDLTLVVSTRARVPRAANAPLKTEDAEAALFSALHALE
jgi:hypothetical protein